jgi:hypothetical protein
MAVARDDLANTVVTALAHAGIEAHVAEPAARPAADLEAHINGARLLIRLKSVSTATPDGLLDRIRKWTTSQTDGYAHLLVADRVVAGARRILRENGWSWLDLRGHLYLSGPGVLVDTPVLAASRVTRPTELFTGTVALEVASALLLAPERHTSVRGLARDLNRSPSSVSAVVSTFREAQLLDEEDRPVTPDLFWELAGAWRPTTRTVARIQLIEDETIANALRIGMTDVTAQAGWALTDTLAAAAYGAPAAVRAGYPPDFYVPDEATANRAATLLGVPVSDDVRGATLRVAPVPQVCTTRRQAPVGRSRWPLAHPLFVALDLATDPTRGREILTGWEPPKGIPRVW